VALFEGVWATVNPSLNPFLGLSGNRQVLIPGESAHLRAGQF
jgi:hypothetical protein